MTHALSSHENSVVYVGNADSNEIFVLQLEQQTGHVRVIERVPIPDVVQPGISTPMAVSPDRRFLYVGVRGQPQRVSSFAITPASGHITYIASGPLAAAWPISSPIAQAVSSLAPPILVTHSR